MRTHTLFASKECQYSLFGEVSIKVARKKRLWVTGTPGYGMSFHFNSALEDEPVLCKYPFPSSETSPSSPEESSGGELEGGVIALRKTCFLGVISDLPARLRLTSLRPMPVRFFRCRLMLDRRSSYSLSVSENVASVSLPTSNRRFPGRVSSSSEPRLEDTMSPILVRPTVSVFSRSVHLDRMFCEDLEQFFVLA